MAGAFSITANCQLSVNTEGHVPSKSWAGMAVHRRELIYSLYARPLRDIRLGRVWTGRMVTDELYTVSIEYLALLENILREISLIDEQRFDSKTIQSICRQVDRAHQEFWYPRYERSLSIELTQERPGFLLCGAQKTPDKSTEQRNILGGNSEIKKLLCYAPNVAVQDWVSDVLGFLSQNTPGTYRDVLRNLKDAVVDLVALKPFVQRGCVTVFPGYDYCRQRWRDVYIDFENESRRAMEIDGDQIRTAMREDRLSEGHPIVKVNMIQEAFFMKKQFGLIPASSDARFLSVARV